jgi:hypothetical protein
MSEIPIEELEDLVEEWQDNHKMVYGVTDSIYSECANDLEELIKEHKDNSE